MVVVVVATGAIRADSGHFGGMRSIYTVSSVHGRAIDAKGEAIRKDQRKYVEGKGSSRYV